MIVDVELSSCYGLNLLAAEGVKVFVLSVHLCIIDYIPNICEHDYLTNTLYEFYVCHLQAVGEKDKLIKFLVKSSRSQ